MRRRNHARTTRHVPRHQRATRGGLGLGCGATRTTRSPGFWPASVCARRNSGPAETGGGLIREWMRPRWLCSRATIPTPAVCHTRGRVHFAHRLRGLAMAQVEKLSTTLTMVAALAAEYEGKGITEQDTKNALIEPVLAALGWPKTDLALVRAEYENRNSASTSSSSKSDRIVGRRRCMIRVYRSWGCGISNRKPALLSSAGMPTLEGRKLERGVIFTNS